MEDNSKQKKTGHLLVEEKYMMAALTLTYLKIKLFCQMEIY